MEMTEPQTVATKRQVWNARRTVGAKRALKASIIYRATGNLGAVQILLGHSNIENTVRYLRIDVEDALGRSDILGIHGDGDF